MGDMLHTYLQDHHAGATVGTELARRAAGANRETAYGAELAVIADEIAEDRQTLERVMAELGVSPSRIKDLGGWAMEKIGRLKPNNSLFSYSPLSRVVELEALALGVAGKQALWSALRATVGESVDGVELGELSARAEDQRRRLEELRRRAANEAFT